MRGCDVCGRPPKWLHAGPFDDTIAVLCGYHARTYLSCIPIPKVWQRWWRKASR